MKRKIQLIFINFLVRHLYNWIPSKDVLVFSGQDIFINGIKIDKKSKQALKDQAQTIKDLEAYTLIKQDLTKAAQDRIFLSSGTADDIFFGKVMLYMLDVIDKKLDVLSKM